MKSAYFPTLSKKCVLLSHSLEGSIFGISYSRLFFYQVCEQASNVIFHSSSVMEIVYL